MHDKLEALVQIIPFVGGTGRLDSQRVFEALIIAGVSAGAAMYGTQQALSENLVRLRQDVQQIRKAQQQTPSLREMRLLRKSHNRLQNRVEAIREDLYMPPEGDHS